MANNLSDQLARDGLRTLLVAERVIINDKDQYADEQEYETAKEELLAQINENVK